MKSTFKLFLILILSINSFAQNKYSENIIQQGNVMGNAMESGNYELLASYTYPSIAALMGGKEQMINSIEIAMSEVKRQGFKITEVKLGEPQKIYIAGDELHCLVPQTIIMSYDKGQLVNDSYLLAASKDEGKSWYFIDTAQLTQENAAEIFPEFNSNLKIPDKKTPRLISN